MYSLCMHALEPACWSCVGRYTLVPKFLRSKLKVSSRPDPELVLAEELERGLPLVGGCSRQEIM